MLASQIKHLLALNIIVTLWTNEEQVWIEKFFDSEQYSNCVLKSGIMHPEAMRSLALQLWALPSFLNPPNKYGLTQKELQHETLNQSTDNNMLLLASCKPFIPLLWP